MAEYLKRDIARILKKRPNTIEFYTSSGLVIPDIEPSQGKGVPRIYSERNLIEFGMIEVMSQMGIPLSTIKRVLKVLRTGKWGGGDEGIDFIVPKKMMTVGETAQWLPVVIADVFRNKDAAKKQVTKIVKRHLEMIEVVINNFWNSEEWALKTDLLYAEFKGFTPEGELIVWEQVNEIDKEESQKESTSTFSLIQRPRPDKSMTTTLWLGSIKKAAMKMVSL